MTAAEAAPDSSLGGMYRRIGISTDGELSWSEEVHFLDDVGQPLYPSEHQDSALQGALASDNHRYGIYDEPGVGKTVPGLAWVLYWASGGNRCLGLMPPTLQGQFVRAMTEQLSGLPDRFLPVSLSEMSKKKREGNFSKWTEEDSWPLVLVMSYQLFRTKSKAPWILVPEKKGSKKLVEQDPEEPYEFTNARILQDAGYDALIFDEAHALKNRSSMTSQYLRQFLGEPGDRGLLIMTGTPVKTDLRDPDGLIHQVSPEAYPTKKSYERQHCVYSYEEEEDPKRPGVFRKKKTLIGFKQIDRLTETLYRRARRLQKTEVYPDMLKPIVSIRDVVLTGPHRTLYRKLVDEMMLEMPDGSILDATTASALRDKALQLVTCPEAFGAPASLKNCMDEAVLEYVDELSLEQTKLLVFCNYRSSNLHYQQLLSSYGVVAMYGDNSPKQNNEAADRFKNDPDCRILIAHPESGGVGHNYQRVCHNVLFIEPASSPGTFTQASERVVRPGQLHPVLIGILRVKGTGYVRRVRTMFERTEAAQRVTRDATTMLDELLGDS